MRSKKVSMLSIFKRKTYLVDLLEGITDFHNHILPGIDDGAKTPNESLELIEKFRDFGITSFVATPHIIGEYYPNTAESIKEAYEKIQNSLPSQTKMSYAAEYMMDQHFVEIIENNSILPVLKQKVLVEMSYFQPPININEILFKLQNNGYTPILAHPERYSYWHSKDLENYRQIKSRGCSFQLNMLSLSGHYGIGIQKTAFTLLQKNMIDYLSSDVHKLAHLEKIKEIKIQKKLLPYIEPVIQQTKELFI